MAPEKAGKQVAMYDPPSVRLLALRKCGNEEQARRFAYEMAKQVKELYMIL